MSLQRSPTLTTSTLAQQPEDNSLSINSLPLIERISERQDSNLAANKRWHNAIEATGSKKIQFISSSYYPDGEQGILLVGGTGSRLQPLTANLNKHLLTVGEMPVFFYPLTNLINAGVRNLVVSTSQRDLPAFQSLLGNGNEFGISIHYHVQLGSRGVATATAECFSIMDEKPTMVALGDTIFVGDGLSRLIKNITFGEGALLPQFKMDTPTLGECVEFAPSGRILDLHEKPRVAPSDIGVGGLYVFDPRAKNFGNDAQESSRGEFDVNAINRAYLDRDSLRLLPQTSDLTYIDTGRFTTLQKAHSVIAEESTREQLLRYSPHLAALKTGFISRSTLTELCSRKADNNKYYSDILQILQSPEI